MTMQQANTLSENALTRLSAALEHGKSEVLKLSLS
jgi:hypothetical protein